jgi:hypothetical protein
MPDLGDRHGPILVIAILRSRRSGWAGARIKIKNFDRRDMIIRVVTRSRHPVLTLSWPHSHGPRARAPTHRQPRCRNRRKARYRLGRAHPSPGSGRTMARTGLRMMPTFPSSPLRFRTAGFPQYGSKAGLSGGAFPHDVQLSRRAVCVHPSCSSLQHWSLRSCRSNPLD